MEYVIIGEVAEYGRLPHSVPMINLKWLFSPKRHV